MLETGDPVDRFADIELATDIHAALHQLPEPYQDVLDRLYCQDQSYARISQDTGLPLRTIASRISRGLAELRQTLNTRTAT